MNLDNFLSIMLIVARCATFGASALVAYELWRTYTLFRFTKVNDIVVPLCKAFIVFAVVRFVIIYPDLYINGLLSNVANTSLFVVIFLLIRRNNRTTLVKAYRHKKRKPKTLSELLDGVILDLQIKHKK